MSRVRIWGTDAGDFVGGRLIWSALKALAPAKAQPPTEVDLSDLALVRPYAIAALAAIGCLSRRKARIVLPLTHDSRDYVVRNGLLEFFDSTDAGKLSPSPRAIPVRQLERVSATFADEITRVWESEFGGMPGGLRPRLADHLDEIVRNALSHARSPIGCVVAAQAYPSRSLIEIAVLDLGQTIRGHLAQNPLHASIKNDRDAIILATGEGVTGTRAGALNELGEPNSGIGLFELRHYCESGGGEVTIASGDAMVTFLEGKAPVASDFLGGFPGCLVAIRFFVESGP